jgi:DNA-binding NarL/FixJ family response regulator
VPATPSAPASFVAAITASRPRVVVLDLDLGSFGDAMGLVTPLSRTGSQVVTLTGSTDRARWGEALHRGARSLVAKSRPLAEVLTTIRRVNDGLPGMDRAERQELIEHWRSATAETAQIHQRLSLLSARESAVLGHLMVGLAVHDIAEVNVVSEATIRSQVKAILAKLEVSSQLAAVGLVNRVGWTAPGQRRT